MKAIGFRSITFLLFFCIFLVLYLPLRNDLRLRHLLILVASYVFYGWWDWRFLSLIVISSVGSGDRYFSELSQRAEAAGFTATHPIATRAGRRKRKVVTRSASTS